MGTKIEIDTDILKELITLSNIKVEEPLSETTIYDGLIKAGKLSYFIKKGAASNSNNILVIRDASKPQPDVYPAGRYSENIHDVAQELMSDVSDQQTLLRLLKQRSKEEISFPKSPFER